MKQVGFKKMNWAPKQSAWNQHVERLNKRRKMMREFTHQQNVMANAFHSAAQNRITGQVETVARTATDRIIAETRKKFEEKLEQLNTRLSGIDKLV